MAEINKKYKVLLVDDVDMNLIILSEIVKSMNLVPLCATRVKDAIEILEEETPSVILLDISMPDVNGLDFCKMLKQDVYTRDIPVIFISALDSSDDLSKAFEVGAVDYIFKPFDPANVRMRVTTHLKMYIMQMELEQANRKLNSAIKKRVSSDQSRQMEFFKALAELAAERDTVRTYGRLRVNEMIHILGNALSFSPDYEDIINDVYINNLEMASSLYDMGMAMLPDSIAIKQGEYTDEERAKMQRHTVRAAEKIKAIIDKYADEDEFTKVLYDMTLCHHENYDGSGYPHSMSGDNIPLAARIMRVVDTYEALTNKRNYREALSHDEAIEFMKERIGTWFDPTIANVFMKINRKFV